MAVEKRPEGLIPAKSNKRPLVHVGVVFAFSFILLFMIFILLASIPDMMSCGHERPIVRISYALNKAIEVPGLIDTVEFTFQPDGVLSAGRITHQTPLGNEQICISKGDFEEEPLFELDTTSNHSIVWKGENDVATRITVICEVDRASLEAGIQEAFSGTDWKFDCSTCGDQYRCCAVILRQP